MSKEEKHLNSLCRKALYQYKMLQSPSIAVALSGGKDSLTLLFLLHAINGKGFKPFKLSALHIDGTFSCGANIDKNYLQAICNKLKIPFIVHSSKNVSAPTDCYPCARERRKLLFNAAKQQQIDTIAFGHHRDDIIQTLLLNLYQKGEFAAMLPKIYMHHYNITIIRPLIFITEKQIIAFAKNNGFMRITCQCPIGQNTHRKKIDVMIREYEKIFPNIRNNLLTSALAYGSTKAAKKPKQKTKLI